VDERAGESSAALAAASAISRLVEGGDLGATPKVAFLFLLVDNLLHESTWNRFFEDATRSSFSVYVHRAANALKHPQPLERWHAREVPRVPSEWCGLVGTMIASLQEALKDPTNTQFAFVSHDAVPLKGFGYVYHHLVAESPSTSKICFASPANGAAEEHHQVNTIKKRARSVRGSR
jgi:hypothetical protein